MKKILKFFALGSALLVASCKGDQGPIGPRGDKGDTGATGATGAVGAAGANGSAIYSDWIDRPYPGTGAGAWTGINIPTATKANFPEYYCSLPAPKITQEIVDKGFVMVYWKGNLSSVIRALPYEMIPFSAQGVTVAMRYFFIPISNGSIEISGRNLYPVLSSGSWLVPSGQFRYIIIPGGVAARKSHVDLNDYEAVKAAYNIPD